MIVHVLRCSIRNQAQDVIAGMVRVRNNGSIALCAQESPGGSAVFERSVLEQFFGRSGGIFKDAKIVEQDLARVEQPKDKLIPARWSIIRRRDRAVTIALPFAGLKTGGPPLRAG